MHFRKEFLARSGVRSNDSLRWIKVVMVVAAMLLALRMLSGSPAVPETEMAVEPAKEATFGETQPVAVHGKEKFTVVVLAWKRYRSLIRLLKSLDAAEYGNDNIKLVIRIDGGSGNDWEESIKVANVFKWKHGEKQVVVAQKNSGLMQAWLDAWKPKSNNDRAIILEDDLAVSPFYYRYVMKMWDKYGNRPEIGAVTLQRERLVAATSRYKTIEQVDPFGYKLLGTWGFSPSARHWKKFLKLDFENLKPIVPGLVTTKWFLRQKKGRMWSQYFIWFCEKNNLYNIYLTPPKRKALASNFREAGVHYSKSKGADFQVLNEWDERWNNPPDVLDLYNWRLQKIAQSTPGGMIKFGSAADIERSWNEEQPEDDDNSEEDTDAEVDGDAGIDDGNTMPNKPDDNTEEVESKEDDFTAELNGAANEGAETLTHNFSPSLVPKAKEIMKGNIMFLQMLNEGFVEMTAAWICNVRHMPMVLDRTLFLCTDKPAYEKLSAFAQSSGIEIHIQLEEHKAPAELRYGDVSYYFFILFRATLLKTLVDSGVSVFLIESDAIWFGDPVKFLTQRVEADVDIVAMHNDYMSPTNINGGFLWLRSTKGTKEILHKLYTGYSARMARIAKLGKENVGGMGNEQQFFKHLLFDKRYNQNGLVAKATLLPSEKFAPGHWFKRDYKNKGLQGPLVVLNNWIAGNEDKVLRAKQLGWWLLEEDGKTCRSLYQNVPTAADFSVSAHFEVKALTSKAFEIQSASGYVFVQVATSASLSEAKRTICRASKNDILANLLVICVDKGACEGLRTFISTSGLKVHLHQEQSNMVQSGQSLLPMYKLMLPYIFGRIQLHTVLIEKSDFISSLDTFQSALDVSSDVSAAGGSSENGLEVLLSRHVTVFHNTNTVKSYIGSYLVSAQKNLFLHSKLPSVKKLSARFLVKVIPIQTGTSPDSLDAGQTKCSS